AGHLPTANLLTPRSPTNRHQTQNRHLTALSSPLASTVQRLSTALTSPRVQSTRTAPLPSQTSIPHRPRSALPSLHPAGSYPGDFRTPPPPPQQSFSLAGIRNPSQSETDSPTSCVYVKTGPPRKPT